MTTFALGAMICGGKSSRMGRDKAFVSYAGRPQIERLSSLLASVCSARVAVCRAAQEAALSAYAPQGVLLDNPAREGVLAAFGLALAHAHVLNLGEPVLVVGCDLPLLNHAGLVALAEGHAQRPEGVHVTCFLDASGRQPEPLASVWTPGPQVAAALEHAVEGGLRCPRRFLSDFGFHGLVARNALWTFNANTPDDAALAEAILLRRDGNVADAASLPSAAYACALPVEVRYFAQLREAAGRSSEWIETSAPDALSLFLEVQRAHGLPLSPQLLRVAVNDGFAAWDTPLRAGDRVAFIPPVSGG